MARVIPGKKVIVVVEDAGLISVVTGVCACTVAFNDGLLFMVSEKVRSVAEV